MKSALALLSLASLAVATPAAPANNPGAQLRMGVDSILAETAENVFGDLFRGAEHLLDAVLHTGEDVIKNVEKVAHKIEEKIESWSEGGKEFVKKDDIVCKCVLDVDKLRRSVC